MHSISLAPAARQSLDTWHQMIATHSMDALGSIVADDVVFRSPVAHTPYPGRAAIQLVLTTVNEVFENFRYHRSLVSEDGHSVVLEFSASVGGKALKGIDMIRFDAAGKIAEFEVMIRPRSGLEALGAAMAARLGDQKQVLTGT
ncbi:MULTISPECIES: nuclear transport factor 2 family protein [unclassified Cupriavidus]|uniref:nuclear transport factor 2 family protein n=1 Tax=unclassified Cupriavidus TaxID=2640874 RepID=UPI00088AACF2|nr:nuclear transport factor 2 family protein [Cupriavidus sp. YR651]SDD61462.1 SnoaL-like domain-containing protein [Cupriavidus sp. YR651]